MSLRDQLEAKARRRCVVPVPVTDPGPARQRVEDAALAIVAAGEGADRDGLTADLEQARAALDACAVEVALQAPAPADAEAILSTHLDDDGSPDYEAALPELLAVCVEDEDLRDVDWWRAQLARPEWTLGEGRGLLLGVLYLVADGPRPLVPKG